MRGSQQLKICFWLPAFHVLACSVAFAQTLGAPANLTATTLTANRVDLSWQDAASGEDGFKIEPAPDLGGLAGAYVDVASVPADSTAFADAGLATAATSWYRVRAYRGSELGPYSNEVSVTPCIGGGWRNMDTGGTAPAGVGLG